MAIVFLLKNGKTVYPSGLPSQTGIKDGNIVNLDTTIKNVRETYGDNYDQAFDIFEFDVYGEKTQIISKCSYERIWQDSNPNLKYVFGQNDKGPIDYRKFLRETALSTVLHNSDSGPSKMTLGPNDPMYRACLIHDILLYQLHSLYIELHSQKESLKELRKRFEPISKLRNHLEYDVKNNKLDLKSEIFDPILDYIKKELEGYKQKSFANRLFRK